MRATLAFVLVFLSGWSMTPSARADRAADKAAPATKPAQPSADRWAGEYHRLGGWHVKDDEPTLVVLVKVGDAYRLRNTRYDDYDFVEEKPGLLWDRRHILGTITRGTLAFEAPDRIGPKKPQIILEANFCYESFYLFGGAAPEAAPATRPAL